MPNKKLRKTSKRIKTLATKTVSAKRAGQVKGGKLYESAGTGKHFKPVTIEL